LAAAAASSLSQPITVQGSPCEVAGWDTFSDSQDNSRSSQPMVLWQIIR